jgi:hypothetical protein
MWSRLPRGELRLHRRVAHLSAERWRLHPVQRPVTSEQHNDDVDGGERRDHQRRSPDAGIPEVDYGPVRDGVLVLPKTTLFQPHSERDQQQANDERRRNSNEDDEPCVRIGEPTREHRDHQRDEEPADVVVRSAPTIASG